MDGKQSPDQQAAALGHDVEWDPPHALSSVSRWTCKTCGNAVLKAGRNVYGSAVEKPCS